MISIAKISEAKLSANKRYDEKTYKQYLLKLRVDDDKEIINSIETAKKNGISMREWLAELYKGQK